MLYEYDQSYGFIRIPLMNKKFMIFLYYLFMNIISYITQRDSVALPHMNTHTHTHTHTLGSCNNNMYILLTILKWDHVTIIM